MFNSKASKWILRNGAILLERRLKCDGTDIVVCFIPDGIDMRFATWQMDCSSMATYWGHYFTSLEEAFADFKAR
jgi:hypothetical protein